MRARYWRERVETTRPGDECRTFVPGRRRASLEAGVPVWFLRLLRATGLLGAVAGRSGSRR